MHPADWVLLTTFVTLAVVFRRGLVADGFGFDRAFAALFMGAKHGETMSYQFAVAQAAGEPWGCWACKWLSRLVEPAHCTKTLTQDAPTPVLASYRAGVLLLALAAVLVLTPWAVGRFL